jgi:hypothetical protein
MVRIVRKGGLVLITCPFMGGLHEEPHDYQRYTKYGLKQLVSRYGEVLEILEQGSLFSAISMLLNEHLNSFASKSTFTYIISVIIYPLFLFFQYISLILDQLFKSDKIFINYLLLVRKR